MADPKKKQYQEELKKIQQLNAINQVLKKGDVENAFLNNTDKETEITKDSAVERMLEELQADKKEKKNLEMLDSLVAEEASSKPTSTSPKKKASKSKKSPKRR